MTFYFLLGEPNSGHGLVRPRPDGVRTRCNGPELCQTCKLEREIVSHADDSPMLVAWEHYMFAQNQRVVGLELMQWRAFVAAWRAAEEFWILPEGL